jgi:hypothetical protein
MFKVSTSGIISTAATAAVLLFALSAAPARAQQNPNGGPVRLKFTFAFPTDSQTKDVTGNPIFGFGFSTDLPNSVMKGGPAVTSIYVDSIYSHKTKNSLTVDLSYLGVGPAVRFYPGRKSAAEAGGPPKTTQFYLGGGFGVYFTRYRLYNNFTATTQTDESGVKFGGKFQAGLDIGPVAFIETEYQIPGTSKGSSINLNIGARFGGSH